MKGTKFSFKFGEPSFWGWTWDILKRFDEIFERARIIAFNWFIEKWVK